MSTQHTQTVEVGDLFRDNDPRLSGNRIVKVLALGRDIYNREVAHVETVEHWNESVIGRLTWISVERLAKGWNRQTGYTKVSR